MTKLYIKYNKHMDAMAKAYCLTLPKYQKQASEPTNLPLIERSIEYYKIAWDSLGEKIIDAIALKAKRSFPYSVVNVNIVDIVDKPSALAMIISGRLSLVDFLQTITHELIHLSWYKETPEYREVFKDTTVSCRQHIIVHAIMEYIFREVINSPDYVVLNKKICDKSRTTDYSDAWKIVEKFGYNAILDKYVVDQTSTK